MPKVATDRKIKKAGVKSATIKGQKAAIYARARKDADDLIFACTSFLSDNCDIKTKHSYTKY